MQIIFPSWWVRFTLQWHYLLLQKYGHWLRLLGLLVIVVQETLQNGYKFKTALCIWTLWELKLRLLFVACYALDGNMQYI